VPFSLFFFHEVAAQLVYLQTLKDKIITKARKGKGFLSISLPPKRKYHM